MARNTVRNTALQISLDDYVYTNLKELSARFGVSVQSLIRLWVGQRLEQEALKQQELERVQLHEPLIPQPGQPMPKPTIRK